VASIMTAHVSYPALDASLAPATLSREILRWFLRQQLKFDGLIVTDALIMEGVLEWQAEREAAVTALDAGCDLLLYPSDVEAVARALEQALREARLDPERVHQSLRRRLKWAQWASPPNEYRRPSLTDAQWGALLADRVVHVVRGVPRRVTSPIEVIVVDDDVGGPYPAASREPFLAALGAGGAEVRRAERPSKDGRVSTVVALFGDIRSWKGRPGYSEAARSAVRRAIAAAPDAVVVQFSHPRLAEQIPDAATVVSAWGGETVMQQAAGRWLLREH
jgi:beta-glucosidase-like glycosyl hydrolase